MYSHETWSFKHEHEHDRFRHVRSSKAIKTRDDRKKQKQANKEEDRVTVPER